MKRFMVVVLECHLCGYERLASEDGKLFEDACACLDPGCDGESGDECGEILLCSDCV